MDEDKLWYICTICYQSFEEAPRLQTHRKLVHPASDTKLVLLLTQQELTPVIKLRQCTSRTTTSSAIDERKRSLESKELADHGGRSSGGGQTGVPVPCPRKKKITPAVPAPDRLPVRPGLLPAPAPVKLEGRTLTATTSAAETEKGSFVSKTLKSSPNSAHPQNKYPLLRSGSNSGAAKSHSENSAVNSVITSTNEQNSSTSTATAPTPTQLASLELKPEIVTGRGSSSSCTPVILGIGTLPPPATLVDGKIRCRICFQEFRTKSSLSTHFLLKHVPKEAPTANQSSSSVVKPDPGQSSNVQQGGAGDVTPGAKRKTTHGGEEHKQARKAKTTPTPLLVLGGKQSESPKRKSRKEEEEFLQKGKVHTTSPTSSKKKRKKEHNETKKSRACSPPLIWVRAAADLLEPEEPEQSVEHHLQVNGGTDESPLSPSSSEEPEIIVLPQPSRSSAATADQTSGARAHERTMGAMLESRILSKQPEVANIKAVETEPEIVLKEQINQAPAALPSPNQLSGQDFRLRDILITFPALASTGYFSANREPSRICHASSSEGIESPRSPGTSRRDQDSTIDEEANKFTFPAHKLGCQYCWKRLDTLAQLDEHISQEHDDNYCDVCQEDLSLPPPTGNGCGGGAAATPAATSARIDKISKKCGTCGKVIEFLRKCQYYLIYTEDRTIRACSCADLSLYSHAELQEGQYKRKEQEPAAGAPLEIKRLKERSCPTCNTNFPSTFEYRNHFTKVHSLGKEWICDVCLRGFTCQNAMLAHQRAASGHAKYQPYKCDRCRMRKHVCQACRREFCQPGALENHQKSSKGTCRKGLSLSSSAATPPRAPSAPKDPSTPAPQRPTTPRGRPRPFRRAAAIPAAAASALRSLQTRPRQQAQPQPQPPQPPPQNFRCTRCPPILPPFSSLAELELHRLTCISGLGPKCSHCALEFEWIYERRLHERLCPYRNDPRGSYLLLGGGGPGGRARR